MIPMTNPYGTPLQEIIVQLRHYQEKAVRDITNAFDSGLRYVLYTLATGGGKTVIFSEMLRRYQHEPCCAIAHRQELVGQISLALARNGIKHRLIAPDTVIRDCIQDHIEDFGKSFYDPNSKIAVAGVDTLIRRAEDHRLDSWMKSVKLWVIDEAHHVLEQNKWGKAALMFPNARGLGVTATPERADGKGLDSVFQTLIVGQSMRQLIDEGHLTDYRVISTPSDIDFSGLTISSTTGDLSQRQLTKRSRNSHIVGDVVKEYKRFANGKPGVTFVTDVETANDVAAQFNANGVPAEALSAKTPNRKRRQIIRRFAQGELKQLVNVDLFGEGFDLPAIEVVSMARRTESFSLYAQQFGRALRLMPGKQYAIIIDHVGNVLRHGLPDKERTWSLSGTANLRERDPNEIPTRACLQPLCLLTFESWERVCPYCGFKPVPKERAGPKFVEGDLTELSPEVLAEMRKATEDNNKLKIPYGATPGIKSQLKKHHANRMGVVDELARRIDAWAAVQCSEGLSIKAAYTKFYRVFGTDTISALGLPTADMTKMLDKLPVQY